MSTRRPQLTFDEIHQLKWLLGGALALFSVWTVFYLDLDIWFLLFFDTVAIVACVAWPRLPSFVPNWIHQAAFPVIVAIFLADLWLEAQVLPAMVRLALLLILYRAVSYRQRRDDLQLIVLGLFLVVLTGVITVSLGFALQIAFFTACALGFLFTITLVDAAEAKDPPPRVPLFTWKFDVATPGWVHQASWGRLFRRVRDAANWKIIAFGSALFFGVVAVSALLFISIPRFQLENSLFLDRFMTKKTRVGFTDNIRFGDVTDIASDTGLALSVQIEDPRTIPAQLYLRMVVLDDYRDGGFRLSGTGLREGFLPEASMFSIQTGERPRFPQKSWTFFFEPGVSRYLPLPAGFEQVRFSERQNARYSPRYRVISLRDEPVSMKAYQVIGPDTSPVLPDPSYAGILAGDRSPSQRAELKLPDLASDREALNSAVAAIAQGQAMDAEEFSRRAVASLQTAHGYSLQSTLPAGNNDPLVRWLGSNVPGHCEYFAGGFTLLARAAGFPARVVTGFLGGTWNPYSNSLTVRNSNAHAWCEVWDAPRGGWLRVDPTPGSGAVTTANEFASDSVLAARTDSSWAARLDSLRIFWYLRIVNFDERDQVATLTGISNAMDRLKASANNAAVSVRKFLQEIWSPRRIALFVAGIAVLAGLGCVLQFWRQDWRWRIGAGGSGRTAEPVRREAGRWLRRFGAVKSEIRMTESEIRNPNSENSTAMPSHSSFGFRTSDLKVLDDLRRLRYAARETWPQPARVFDRARREWRAARRSALSAKR